MSDLLYFILRFGFNLLVAWILVRVIYYPATHNKRYVFTFLAFNTVIFFVLSFLTSIEISLGVGFGLFAIFTILRYRTDPIPVREMTYLFVIVALPVMNTASSESSLWLRLIAANLATLVIMFILEHEWGFHYESSKRILYEKIELIRPDRYNDLCADLEERTGLKIKRISVGKVNFLRDTADLTIYFDEMTGDGWLNNEETDPVLVAKDDPDD